MESIVKDLRHAVRTLSRAPAFAVTVVLILAIGIGASTAIFSLVNAALIRPLPFTEAHRLVDLKEGAPDLGFGLTAFSPPDLLDVQQYQQSFEGVGAYRNLEFELSGIAEAERVVGAKTTANLFPLLGIEPEFGRLFAATEDQPGNDLAVISWDLWQRRYQGSDEVIGASIQLDRRPYTVIGVMPERFSFPLRGPAANSEPADVWVPMAFTEQETSERGSRFNNSVIGRLRDGATVAEAQAELDVLARQVAAEYPPILQNNADALRMSVQPLREEVAGAVRTPLLMLLAAIGLVLIVACANVANLILSRAVAKERDYGIRVALGATRARLFQRHAVEATLLTSVGAVVGVMVAFWIVNAVPNVVARVIPGLDVATLDIRVLAFSALIAIVTGIVFGGLPILASGGRDFRTMQDGGLRATPRRQHRLQHSLVISTVALAFILLVGAGLFVRSFGALLATDPGFRSTGVVSVSLALPREGYPTAQNVRNFHAAVIERAAQLPGVRTAAVATDLPLESYEMRMYTPERAQTDDVITGSTLLSWVHGPYFETLGLELSDGRVFRPEEYAEQRQVVVINEALANQLWPDDVAVGQRLKWGPPESPTPWLTVVGVVSDVPAGSQLSAVMRDDRPVHAYEPFRQFPGFFLDDAVSGFGRDVRLAVHTEGDPTSLVAPLRRELASLDPQLAVARVALMDDLKAERVAPQRFTTALLAAFGIVGLLLASIGLYGILSFTVEQHRREIGVRVALGARPLGLVRMMILKGVALAGVGMALGLAGALGVNILLRSFLYEISAYDPLTFVAVPLVLAGAALVASALPALRASRLDPVQSLRAE